MADNSNQFQTLLADTKAVAKAAEDERRETRDERRETREGESAKVATEKNRRVLKAQ